MSNLSPATRNFLDEMTDEVLSSQIEKTKKMIAESNPKPSAYDIAYLEEYIDDLAKLKYKFSEENEIDGHYLEELFIILDMMELGHSK